MKGFVWRWMVALCVFPEIVAAQNNVASGNERNVALQGTCYNSTLYRWIDYEKGNCTWIINGDRNISGWYGINCFSTSNNDSNPYLTVILRQSYFIHKLVIYAREKEELRIKGINVFFDGVQVYTFNQQTNVSIWNIPKNERREARNVTLTRTTTTGTDKVPYINFCEFEIYSCREGYWGDNCNKSCGVGCANTCNAKDGQCDCQLSWRPPRCEVPSCTCGECEGDNKYVFSELSRKINVAVGKNSTASTTLKEPKPVSGPACLANNGKTESTMVPIPSSAPECMSTAEGDLKPFWQVDLGEQYVVAGILIEWDNQMKSLFGIRVLLDGKELYYSEQHMGNPTELAANDLGQVVRLQREKFENNTQWDDALLRICEVEVYTCWPGYYGPDCLGICDRPVCDNLQICSRINGSCPKDAPVEVKELDCSKLIIVAGCFVHVLVVALCILAAKVLPRKKRSGTKPRKDQTDTDQTKSSDESKEGKGEQSSKSDEAESGESASVEEAESEV